MVIEVTVAEAEARMDELFDAAIQGEQVVITQDGVRRAMLELVPSDESEHATGTSREGPARP